MPGIQNDDKGSEEGRVDIHDERLMLGRRRMWIVFVATLVDWSA